MAFISISGEPGCRQEEVARMASQRLACELVTEAQLVEMVRAEFCAAEGFPEKTWPHLARATVAKLGAQFHLVVTSTGGEFLLDGLTGVLKTQIIAPESRRLANLMVDCGLDREEATKRLRALDREMALTRKRRFGVSNIRLHNFDLVMNAGALGTEQMADLLGSAVHMKGLLEEGLLPAEAEAQVQFQARLTLAGQKIGLSGASGSERREFSHPSEEVFANLLDFYRIGWNYEPRSFPLQWDKDGKVLEAFTPDFYLPEFDLYVELTTMKQANVTKKNRKIRLLRAIYPHINIQVFYQKDVQDLVMKYGLPERLAR
jgi:cytidylate kinase